MKRRKFISTSILAGLGITLAPKLALSNSNLNSTIYIGEINEQHRHGNLFAEHFQALDHTIFKSISRNIFYKNGSSPSDNDAYSISLMDKERNLHSYFILDNKVLKTKGEKVSFKNNQDKVNGCNLNFKFGSKNLKLNKNQILIPIQANKNKAQIFKHNQNQLLSGVNLIMG